MDRILAIRNFVRAVETGSFSAVAREEHASQPAVSKRIAWLERELGVRLLERTTRRLELTAAGQRYLEHARNLLRGLDDAEDAALGTDSVASGRLRIAAPDAMARLCLMPWLKYLRQEHAAVEIDLQYSEHTANLARDCIDLAVQVGPLGDEGLIARQAAMTRRMLVAAPDYLRRHGTPLSLSDLDRHQCILHTGQPNPGVWCFPDGPELRAVEVRGGLRISSSEGVLRAVQDGHGIAYVPQWLAGSVPGSEALQHVLPGIATEELPIWILRQPASRNSATVRLVAESLRRALAQRTAMPCAPAGMPDSVATSTRLPSGPTRNPVTAPLPSRA